MWEFLGAHHNLLLGLVTGVVWIVAVTWFLYLTGFLEQWRNAWRERRKRQTW